MRNTVHKTTDRGFVRLDFDDRYGERCSLQESSLAEEAAIWLGQNEPTIATDGTAMCRMHLTQDDVRELLPMLQHFVETGELPRPTEAQDPTSAPSPSPHQE